jgi:hypothetical protein
VAENASLPQQSNLLKDVKGVSASNTVDRSN